MLLGKGLGLHPVPTSAVFDFSKPPLCLRIYVSSFVKWQPTFPDWFETLGHMETIHVEALSYLLHDYKLIWLFSSGHQKGLVQVLLLLLSCFSGVQLLAPLWTIACQAPLSMRFSRQEYWSGLPWFPSVDLPDPGIERTSLMSSTLYTDKWFFTTSTAWEAPRESRGDINSKKKIRKAVKKMLRENLVFKLKKQ